MLLTVLKCYVIGKRITRLFEKTDFQRYGDVPEIGIRDKRVTRNYDTCET